MEGQICPSFWRFSRRFPNLWNIKDLPALFLLTFKKIYIIMVKGKNEHKFADIKTENLSPVSEGGYFYGTG